MGIFDNIANMIHESSLGNTNYNDYMYKQLKGFSVKDTQLSSSGYYGVDPQNQVNNQIEGNKNLRDYLFSRVDIIKNNHIAISIKNSITGDCFQSFCDRKLFESVYRSDNEENNKLFSKDLQDYLDKTNFRDIFKNCLLNGGMDYCEFFLRTKCEIGKGIVEISDDVNVKKHLALYKNLKPIGFIKFYNKDNNKVKVENFIDADEISHFMVNPQKISLEINIETDKEIEIPEKIMCSLPLLAPVVDLIIQYNALEYVSTGVELCNVLSPTILSTGVSSDSDMVEITRQLQQYSIALNASRNNILNNLENIDSRAISREIGKIELVPYTIEEGTNSMKQITITKTNTNLSEKLNDVIRTITKAMGMPEGYLASVSVKGNKEENISTNPRYSRVLSGILQSLASCINEHLYKHLKYKYTKIDANGEAYLERRIDKNFIDTRFNSITNIDNRLAMEQYLLVAETMSNIVSFIDTIVGSPNIPAGTNAESFNKFWLSMTEATPGFRDSVIIDDKYKIDNVNVGDENYNDEANTDGEIDLDKDNLSPELTKEKDKLDKKLDEKDIKDIFY